MTSTADGRLFPEEEPTGKFESETLDALRARSLEKSAVFNASIDGPPLAAMPPAPAAPTRSSPEFLGKSTAVLVLPSEPPPPPPAPFARPAPPAAPLLTLVEPAPAVARPEPPAPAARATPEAPVVRTHRRISARAAVKPRRRIWRHVMKLALLALVVLCQPWWWNVGDQRAHAAKSAAAKTK